MFTSNIWGKDSSQSCIDCFFWNPQLTSPRFFFSITNIRDVSQIPRPRRRTAARCGHRSLLLHDFLKRQSGEVVGWPPNQNLKSMYPPKVTVILTIIHVPNKQPSVSIFVFGCVNKSISNNSHKDLLRFLQVELGHDRTVDLWFLP